MKSRLSHCRLSKTSIFCVASGSISERAREKNKIANGSRRPLSERSSYSICIARRILLRFLTLAAPFLLRIAENDCGKACPTRWWCGGSESVGGIHKPESYSTYKSHRRRQLAKKNSQAVQTPFIESNASENLGLLQGLAYTRLFEPILAENESPTNLILFVCCFCYLRPAATR